MIYPRVYNAGSLVMNRNDPSVRDTAELDDALSDEVLDRPTGLLHLATGGVGLATGRGDRESER
jgi:hypothetical protein